MLRDHGRRLGRATAVAVVTFAAVLAAGAFVLGAIGRTPDPSFGIGRAGFVERWNAAAGDHPDLRIPSVEWTDEEAGVFGHAFTPTLSVLGRVAGPLRDVVELAVVGTPSADGEERVAAALDLAVAVAEPALDAGARRQVLADLALLGPGRPAAPEATIERGGTRFLSASDPARGRIGIGAEAVGDP